MRKGGNTVRVVIYIRVSTDEQAKEGYSLDAQLEKLEAFCFSQGWTIVKIYREEGESAKDINRTQLQLLLQELHLCDVVLVYKLDRLSRSVSDINNLLQTFDNNKVSFKSATEPYDTTTAQGKLLINIFASLAQFEREQLSERVRMGMEKKTKTGKWKGGMAPYGYKVVNKNLEVNNDEVEVINKIFFLSKKHGFFTIARTLTELGYKTRNGDTWHVDTVRGIANNPVYAGYLTFSENSTEYKKSAKEKNLFDGNHQRIISREEFWELQDILEKRRSSGSKRETSNYYFSSILKCGRCGHSMSGHKSPTGKTYRCSGKKAGKKCTSHIIKEEYLLRTVLNQLDEIFSNIKGVTEINDVSKTKIDQLEQELKSIQKLIKKQKSMFEADIIDIDELIEKTESLRENEKKIMSELKQLKQADPTKSDNILYISENIKSLWEYADDLERKQMVNTLFTQLVVDTVDDYKRGSGIPREIIIVSSK
jgi:site-specific DNA recombinase